MIFNSKRTLTLIKIIAFLVGGAFLVYWIDRIGAKDILQTILSLKWWILPILANSFLWYVFYTLSWRSYFSNLDHIIPFWHLLKIKICGEALNLMTPLGFVVGDPVRAVMLQKHLGLSTRLGSVMVDRLLHSFATVFFVLIGLTLLLFMKSEIPISLRGALVGLYLVINGFFFLIITEIIRGKGLQKIKRFIKWIKIDKRFPKITDFLIRLDEELVIFQGHQARTLFYPFTLHLLGRVLGAVEIAIIFYYLSGEIQLLFGIILAALTATGHLLFIFVPGGWGVIESLYGFVFYAFGYPPATGVTLQLIRRLRSGIWIIFGFLLLNLTHRFGKKRKELTA